MEYKAYIRGTGFYVPPKVLTNFDFEKMVDTSDEWITQRTGIKERHIADENTATSDMCIEAAKMALEDAKIDKSEIDMILIGTVTPDYMFPSTAAIVQYKLGLNQCPAFDFEAACSGFIYGLSIAKSFIISGTYKNILIFGAETLTKITDWKDRNSCVLFGDGAGAAVVSLRDNPDNASEIKSIYLGADGSLGNLLLQPAGGSRMPASAETVEKRLHTIQMGGREVFKNAILNMVKAAETALKMENITGDQLAMVISHQANVRIVNGVTDRLGVPREKSIINLDKYGNTSAASIPIALAEAVRDGRIKKGDLVLLVAFGGGFTWGAAIIQW